MKPTVVIASATLVVAAGLAVFISLPDRGGEENGLLPEELTASKLTQRHGGDAATDDKRAPVMGRRPTPGVPLSAEAVAKMEDSMSPELRAAYMEGRAKNHPTPEQTERANRQVAAAKDMAKVREKLAAAVQSDPDGWVDTYNSVMQQHRDTFGSPVGGMFGGGGGTTDPGTTPTDPGGDDSGDGGEVVDNPGLPPGVSPDWVKEYTKDFDLEEAVRLKDYYHSVVDNNLPPMGSLKPVR
ncbi:hypothetical protein [Haloferula sargassicola]|uniref:Uncharacterized protein n=1 Tax=Haloferula sargassicola TaxID=490096 RepID=A0ABP9UNE2_9BACT